MISRIGAGVAVALWATGAFAQTPAHRCTPTEAVSNSVDTEAATQLAASNASVTALQKMEAISDKAKIHNVAIKDQITASDQQAFNEARGQMIKIAMFKSAESRDVRNMRVLEQLSFYDEVINEDHFDFSTIKENDPRAFYFKVIGALREIQPNPPATTLPDAKGGCTMEAALSLIEHFNMNMMASDPTRQESLNTIQDTRRLEQLLAIMRKAKELDEEDASNIRLDASGDAIAPSGRFKKWLADQPASSQAMGNVVLDVLDQVLPSKSHYEIDDQAAQTDRIKAEYPVHK